MTKTLTPKQEDFLEALLGEARGNIRSAMDIAGYSRTTKTAEVVGPLKEEITERAGMMLAMNAPKAAFGIVDVLDDPPAMVAVCLFYLQKLAIRNHIKNNHRSQKCLPQE